jgi:hypothetical protein
VALDHQARNVIVRYEDQVAAVRETILGYIRRRWESMAAYHQPDVEAYVRAVTPVVTAGQIQVAALTDVYLASIEAAVLGRPARLVGVPRELVTTEALRGVPHDEMWRRPGVAVWSDLSQGHPLEEAVAAGAALALVLAATNLQLARTHASRHILSNNPRVVGYRRVLSANACELCQTSTHRFGKDELMPIHNSCTCSTIAVYGHEPDPGVVEEGAPAVDGRGQSTVRDNGELGPELVAE